MGATPRLNDSVVIVRGRHANEPAVVVGCYSNGPAGRHRTLDVILASTGDRVNVLATSVEVYR